MKKVKIFHVATSAADDSILRERINSWLGEPPAINIESINFTSCDSKKSFVGVLILYNE